MAGATNIALDNSLFIFGSSGRHCNINRPSEWIDVVVGKACAMGRQQSGCWFLANPLNVRYAR